MIKLKPNTPPKTAAPPVPAANPLASLNCNTCRIDVSTGAPIGGVTYPIGATVFTQSDGTPPIVILPDSQELTIGGTVPSAFVSDFFLLQPSNELLAWDGTAYVSRVLVSAQSGNDLSIGVDGGLFLKETETTIDDLSLSGNNLILKYTGEDGVQQVKNVDLSLFAVDVNVQGQILQNPSTGVWILELTETDGTVHSVDLSSLLAVVTANTPEVTLSGDGTPANPLKAEIAPDFLCERIKALPIGSVSPSTMLVGRGGAGIPPTWIGYDFDLPTDFGTTDATDTYLHLVYFANSYYYPPATASPTTPILLDGNEAAIRAFINSALVADGFNADDVILVVNADKTVTVWINPTYTPNSNEFWMGMATPDGYTAKFFPTIPTTHVHPESCVLIPYSTIAPVTPLPTPKVQLGRKYDSHPVQIEWFDGVNNAVGGTLSVKTPPIVNAVGITNEHIAKGVFLEMLHYRGVGRQYRNGMKCHSHYVGGVGLTGTDQGGGIHVWRDPLMANPTVPLAVDRPNMIAVTAINQVLDAWTLLQNQFTIKDTKYTNLAGVEKKIKTAQPVWSYKRSAFSASFHYSGAYKPLYISFRYAYWDNGVKVVSPASDIICVTNEVHPFLFDPIESGVVGKAVCSISGNYIETDMQCFFDNRLP